MRWRGWFFLAVTLAGLARTGSAQPTLRIDSAFQKSYLSCYLSRVDTTGAVSTQVLPRQFSRFRPVTDPDINYRNDLRHHYLRFRLLNTGNTPRPPVG